jgi:hypothetical protein
MFSQLSSTTTVLFPSEGEASIARNLWGPTFRGKVLSIDPPESSKGYGKLRSRRFSAAEQEAALLASDGIYVPEGTEVLILAGPRAKDFKKIRRIEAKLGMATLIILINARADAVETLTAAKKNKSAGGKDKEGVEGTAETEVALSDTEWIHQTFNSIFNYAPPAVEAGGERELLLYHEIADKWALVEKEKDTKGILGTGLGAGGVALRAIWEGDSRPTFQQLTNIIAETKAKD